MHTVRVLLFAFLARRCHMDSQLHNFVDILEMSENYFDFPGR